MEKTNVLVLRRTDYKFENEKTGVEYNGTTLTLIPLVPDYPKKESAFYGCKPFTISVDHDFVAANGIKDVDLPAAAFATFGIKWGNQNKPKLESIEFEDFNFVSNFKAVPR